jgi:hypothetical protein
MATKRSAQFVTELARKTGVAQTDVQKVLTAIGFSAVMREVTRTAGPEATRRLGAKNLKLAVRLGKASIAV